MRKWLGRGRPAKAGVALVLSLMLGPGAHAAAAPGRPAFHLFPVGPDGATFAGLHTVTEGLPETGPVPPARYPRRVVHDLAALVRMPAHLHRREWAELGAGVGLVGAVALLDNRARDLVRRDSDPEDLHFARSIRPLGREGGLALLGVAWLTGETADSPETVATAEDGLEATILAAGVVTPLLKALAGRARPRQGEGDRSFRAFGGHESFPSGEAAEAFAIASVVSAHSHRPWVQGLAWGFAATVGWERMRLDAHWASDVVAGGLIGTVVGRWVVDRHRPKTSSGARFAIAPAAALGGYGVGVDVRF